MQDLLMIVLVVAFFLVTWGLVALFEKVSGDRVFVLILSGVVSLLLLAYLFYALTKPEKL